MILESFLKIPVFWLMVTVGVWVAAQTLYQRYPKPWFHPNPVSIGVLVFLLWFLDVEYSAYFDGAYFLHFLLGPATVALAYPLWRQVDVLRRNLIPVAMAAVAGLILALGGVLLGAWLTGLEAESARAALARSLTTPIALGSASLLQADPALIAVMVVGAGVLGASVGPPFLRRLGIRDPRALGFGIGWSSHGLGTSRAVQEGPVEGAWSSLGLCLAAFLIPLLLPLALWLGMLWGVL
jgi:putative effector of murein hydrolase